MKVLFLLLFLSLRGNDPSDSGITYRILAWSDFRGSVPDTDLSVAARTTTELAMETTEINDRSSFVVTAHFLPYASYVRVKTSYNLRHEQTHFQIACIEAIKCMVALEPLQKGDSGDKDKAFTLYNASVAESARRNVQFDAETRHGLDVAAEKVWEDRISCEMRTFGNVSKSAYGRSR